ncbi:MAG: hypothetical protein R6V44_15505 [Paracoccaceae bacterium]
MSRGRALSALALLAGLAVLAWWQGWYGDVARWAAYQQRDVQNAIAAAVTALRRGEPGALATLIGGAFAYGFVHAVGPGHGKALIGGAAIGSAATARRMAALALISSLAQSGTAILLVYGGLGLLAFGATQAMDLTERWLMPASALAMAGIAGVLILRGGRALLAAGAPAPALVGVPHGHGHAHAHDHGPDCGCGHRHAPTAEEVENVHSLRDALALIAGVAIRPCTGALILLVIAWRADLVWAGLAAVVAMGLGTASFVTAVAVSAVAARNAALFAGRGARIGATLQIAAGVLIGAGAGAVLAGTLAA